VRQRVPQVEWPPRNLRGRNYGEQENEGEQKNVASHGTRLCTPDRAL
jgi:hypothetical protein